MNPFDIAIAVILGYGIILGILRGFIREITSIAGILGGFYVAYRFYDGFAVVFSPFFENAYYPQIISFLILFVAIVVGMALLGMLLRTFLKLLLLGVVDRILGALFGGVKAVLIVSVLFFLLTTFLPPGGVAMIRDSRLAPAANAVANAIVFVIPQETKQAVVKKMEHLRWQWERKTASLDS